MYHTYCFIHLLHENFPSNNDKNITTDDFFFFKKKLHNSCFISSLFSESLSNYKGTSATHSMSVCLYLDIKNHNTWHIQELKTFLHQNQTNLSKAHQNPVYT